MQNIVFYRDGKLVQYSDDPTNPGGITFENIEPIATDALTSYLTSYENRFAELDALRNSGDAAVANNSRKQINLLNRERAEKLSLFCKQIQQGAK